MTMNIVRGGDVQEGEEAVVRRCFIKVIKKETLAQVFSCEFCKIYKNTFFTEYFRTPASEGDENMFGQIELNIFRYK